MRRALWFLVFVVALPAAAGYPGACDLSVVVDGSPRVEYEHRGTVYVEAVRGREYSLRLTNPMPYRVAVALSVDGLNSIDAKHTTAWKASKWVLDPYESVDIEGWQVSDSAARRFYFTGERDSYGAKRGMTENLGVIEAVFYRERLLVVPMDREVMAAPPPAAASSAPSAKGLESGTASRQAAVADDYAATGMGNRTRHDVRRVDIDLDPTPITTARIRYEFHPQLVKLGVLPRYEDPLRRREKARGFGGYCPER